MDTKRCSKCGEVKSVDAFHNDKQTSDGLASWCRTCRVNMKYNTCPRCGNRKAKASIVCRKCCDNDKRKNVKNNFWLLVNISNDDDCWLWKGNIGSRGYGRYAPKHGVRIGAHRLAYIYTHGKIPPGMFVCHTCDNPLCCNPRHLFIGTHRDNILDMTRKERGNTVKLTASQVAKMRHLYNSGAMDKVQLAQEYKVDPSTVYAAITRRTWRHVP